MSSRLLRLSPFILKHRSHVKLGALLRGCVCVCSCLYMCVFACTCARAHVLTCVRSPGSRRKFSPCAASGGWAVPSADSPCPRFCRVSAQCVVSVRLVPKVRVFGEQVLVRCSSGSNAPFSSRFSWGPGDPVHSSDPQGPCLVLGVGQDVDVSPLRVP